MNPTSSPRWSRRFIRLTTGTALSLSLIAPTWALDHAHVQIGFTGGTWDLLVYDFDQGRLLTADKVFPVPVLARGTIPEDSRYTVFPGAAGRLVWALPQIDRTGLISLGAGTTGIGPRVLVDNTLRLELH